MPEAEAATPAPRRVPLGYRAVFGLGVGLYSACFVAGIGYVVATRRELPAVSMNALSEAEGYLAEGNLQRAAREYRMVSAIDRGNYETPRRLAELLRRAGDPSGQIDQYLRARTLWPRDPATHRSLAWAFYNNRRFDEALASFRDALSLQPEDVESQRGIGEVWLEQDRYPEAIAALREVIRLDPQNAVAHNSLGIACVLSGARGDALRHFEEAARLAPRQEILANLERARAEAARAGRP